MPHFFKTYDIARSSLIAPHNYFINSHCSTYANIPSHQAGHENILANQADLDHLFCNISQTINQTDLNTHKFYREKVKHMKVIIISIYSESG